MADENIEIAIKVQLKEANTELIKARENFGNLSKEALNAAKRVGELREKIGDARQQADAFTDGGKFKALSGTLAGVAGGFSAIQGAMALVSKDSKALAETTKKLQAAMALTQGLTALSQLGDAFGTLKTVAVTSLKAIRTALGTLGIGLLIAGLAVVVANWEKIKKVLKETFPALNDTASLFDKIKEVAMGAATVIFRAYAGIGKAIMNLVKGNFSAALEDLKSGFDMVENYQQGAEKQRERNAQNHQDELLAQQIKAREKRIEVLQAEGKDTYALEKKNIQDKIKLAEEGSEEIETLRQEERVLDAEHRKTLKNQSDKAYEQAKKDREKAEAERQKAEADRIAKINEVNAAIDEIEKEALLRTLSKRDREVAEIQLGYTKRFALIKGNADAEALLRKQMNADIAAVNEKYRKEDLTKDEEALDKKYDLLKLEATKTIDNKEDLNEELIQLEIDKLEEEIALKKKYGEDTVALEQELADKIKFIDDKKKEDKKKNEEEILGIIQESLGQAAVLVSAISDLNEARMNKELAEAGDNEAKKEEIRKSYFEKQKKLDITNATITGIQAAISSFAAGAKIGGPIVGGVFAAISAAATSAQIAKINSIQYSGGSSSSSSKESEGGRKSSKFADGGLLVGPSHMQGGIKTPLGELEGNEYVINKRSTAAYLPLIEAINNMGKSNATPSSSQAPVIKTYVVASEMTTQQEADKKIADIARL